MYKYTISKYNPLYRDKNGRYLKEDWTAISDIGKVFDGTELIVNDYLKTEDSYIRALQLIMQYFELSYLNVSDARRSFGEDEFKEIIDNRKIKYTQDIFETYNHLEKFKKLNEKELNSFCRLMLREDIGAKVFYPRLLKIFICYDYLMGIHSSKSLKKIIPEIEALGLFVEEFK